MPLDQPANAPDTQEEFALLAAKLLEAAEDGRIRRPAALARKFTGLIASLGTELSPEAMSAACTILVALFCADDALGRNKTTIEDTLALASEKWRLAAKAVCEEAGLLADAARPVTNTASIITNAAISRVMSLATGNIFGAHLITWVREMGVEGALRRGLPPDVIEKSFKDFDAGCLQSAEQIDENFKRLLKASGITEDIKFVEGCGVEIIDLVREIRADPGAFAKALGKKAGANPVGTMMALWLASMSAEQLGSALQDGQFVEVIPALLTLVSTGIGFLPHSEKSPHLASLSNLCSTGSLASGLTSLGGALEYFANTLSGSDKITEITVTIKGKTINIPVTPALLGKICKFLSAGMSLQSFGAEAVQEFKDLIQLPEDLSHHDLDFTELMEKAVSGVHKVWAESFGAVDGAMSLTDMLSEVIERIRKHKPARPGLAGNDVAMALTA